MSGRILIVDRVATNRILLKVKLEAAQYSVTCCPDLTGALNCVRDDCPDLILLEASNLADDPGKLCAAIAYDAAQRSVPILAMGQFQNAAQRMTVLESGADELIAKPFTDTILLARIRNLLRARDADAELNLRDDTRRALGFAEDISTYDAPGRVAFVTGPISRAKGIKATLSVSTKDFANTLDPDHLLSPSVLKDVPDLLVINAQETDAASDNTRIFRLVSDLKSRSETRNVAQLVLIPQGADDMAAMALDLGANDVAEIGVSEAELQWRINKLVRQKRQQEQLRNTLQTGLMAAVTDPLTGLYNRRYALPHLRKLAERSAQSGKKLAIMLVDIDHFKRVNDTYGHLIGDAVIAGVAERLKDGLRAVDLLARIGGEEFLIALPETTEAKAQAAAERLRARVQSTPFDLCDGNGAVSVTLSIGVTVSDGSSDLPDEVDSLLARADAALYAAKSSGRNQVNFSLSAA